MVWINIDIAGFIVAVLGLITTILLGWNIYTLIDFKEKIKRVDLAKKAIKDSIKQLRDREYLLDGNTHSMIANTYLSIIEGDVDKSIYITEKAHALISYSIAHQTELCNRTVSEMLAYIRSDYGKNISNEAYQILHDILNNVKTINDIQDIQVLIGEIYIQANRTKDAQQVL